MTQEELQTILEKHKKWLNDVPGGERPGRIGTGRSFESGGVRMKLGSLFDGSGTCPLAARMCGIEPVWASDADATD